MSGLRFGLSLSMQGRGRAGVAWMPLNLGAALLAWWCADRSDLITLSGNQVTSWKDAKNAYDAVQAVSAARPTWSATGFNGAPGLTLDGIDDCLGMASQPFPSGSDPVEIWGVVQQDALPADTGVRHLISYGGGAATTRRTLSRVVSGGVNRGAAQIGNGTANPSPANTTIDLSSRHLARSIVTSTTASVSVDASALTSLSVVPATGAARLRIGASDGAAPSAFWSGKIRDVVITSALSTDEATQLQSYLLARRML
ncbi:MAG: hypothetical protein QG602_1530 [Verrucomicrobiota bacterium]|nr:hypothetical protein [Verrucomicrobiota bacterium]